MKISLKILALALVVLGSNLAVHAKDHSVRVGHWKTTISALKKAGHAQDSEVMHWAEKNLKRAEHRLLNPNEKHHAAGKYAATKTAKVDAGKDESWFRKAEKYVTGQTAAAAAATTAGATKAASAVKAGANKAANAVKAKTHKTKAEKLAEEKHQEELARRRAAYRRHKAEEAKALNLK